MASRAESFIARLAGRYPDKTPIKVENKIELIIRRGVINESFGSIIAPSSPAMDIKNPPKK